MKILYFLPHITNSGGMERIVMDKINYLVQEKYQVYLAYFGKENDTSFFYIDENVHRCPIPFDTNNLSFKKRIRYVLSIIGRVKQLIVNNRIDVVVNANTPLVSWILPFICKNIPKVLELHFSYEGLRIMNKELYGKNVLKAKFNQILRQVIYPLYDKCVLLTDDDKKAWNLKNSEVIPNFTNLDSSCKSKMNRIKALSVGRLTYQKNMDILIDAWQWVYKVNPKWSLDIWGDGDDLCFLQKKIIELGLENVVFLRGTSQCLQNEYPKYSLFILPSRYEGFPLVLVEAMQFGLPCIGFKIPGNTTVIKNGINGYIVEKRDAQLLGQTINKAINSESALKEMSQNALETITRFSKEKIMSQWIDLFNQVIKKKL